jgi:hypothetical protein
MSEPEERATPSYVRKLTSGTEVTTETLELDTATFRNLAEKVREIEASRAAAVVSGRDYVIR